MMGFASCRGEHIPPSPRGVKLLGSPQRLSPRRRPLAVRAVSPLPAAPRPAGVRAMPPEPRYLRGALAPAAVPAALPAFRNRAKAPANHFPDPDALIELPRLPDGQPGRVLRASPGAGGFRSAPAC